MGLMASQPLAWTLMGAASACIIGMLCSRCQLKADRELVLEAVRQIGRVSQHAVAVLRAGCELVPEAVRRDGAALRYAAGELIADHGVLRQAAASASAAAGTQAPSSPSEMLPRRAVLWRPCPTTWRAIHCARVCQQARRPALSRRPAICNGSAQGGRARE